MLPNVCGKGDMLICALVTMLTPAELWVGQESTVCAFQIIYVSSYN